MAASRPDAPDVATEEKMEESSHSSSDSEAVEGPADAESLPTASRGGPCPPMDYKAPKANILPAVDSTDRPEKAGDCCRLAATGKEGKNPTDLTTKEGVRTHPPTGENYRAMIRRVTKLQTFLRISESVSTIPQRTIEDDLDQAVEKVISEISNALVASTRESVVPASHDGFDPIWARPHSLIADDDSEVLHRGRVELEGTTEDDLDQAAERKNPSLQNTTAGRSRNRLTNNEIEHNRSCGRSTWKKAPHGGTIPNTEPSFTQEVKMPAEKKRRSYLQYITKSIKYNEYMLVRNRINSERQTLKAAHWETFSTGMERDLFGGQKKVWNMLRSRKKPINPGAVRRSRRQHREYLNRNRQ
ncbi:hypothetical protein HUJ05_009761 [Dendroctonus ponderosae]|nr:hypothetical protein HUJ05_009761 [Dendroctonus ponderosae]